MYGSPVLTQYTQESDTYRIHRSLTLDLNLKHTQESGRTHLGTHSAVWSQDAHSTNGSLMFTAHESPNIYCTHGSPTLTTHIGVRSLNTNSTHGSLTVHVGDEAT